MALELLQPWVKELPLMQQTMLLTAIRSPDGVPRRSSCRNAVYMLRRVVLISATEGRVLALAEDGGGEFMPRVPSTVYPFKDILEDHDYLPHHFLLHLIHAFEIVGYKYPHKPFRSYCLSFYRAMCNALHMTPETVGQLDKRLYC